MEDPNHSYTHSFTLSKQGEYILRMMEMNAHRIEQKIILAFDSHSELNELKEIIYSINQEAKNINTILTEIDIKALKNAIHKVIHSSYLTSLHLIKIIEGRNEKQQNDSMEGKETLIVTKQRSVEIDSDKCSLGSNKMEQNSQTLQENKTQKTWKKIQKRKQGFKAVKMGGVSLYLENHTRNLNVEEKKEMKSEQQQEEPHLDMKMNYKQFKKNLFAKLEKEIKAVEQNIYHPIDDELSSFLVFERKFLESFNHCSRAGDLQEVINFFNKSTLEAADFLKKTNHYEEVSQLKQEMKKLIQQLRDSKVNREKSIETKFLQMLGKFNKKRNEMTQIISEKIERLEKQKRERERERHDNSAQTQNNEIKVIKMYEMKIEELQNRLTYFQIQKQKKFQELLEKIDSRTAEIRRKQMQIKTTMMKKDEDLSILKTEIKKTHQKYKEMIEKLQQQLKKRETQTNKQKMTMKEIEQNNEIIKNVKNRRVSKISRQYLKDEQNLKQLSQFHNLAHQNSDQEGNKNPISQKNGFSDDITYSQEKITKNKQQSEEYLKLQESNNNILSSKALNKNSRFKQDQTQVPMFQTSPRRRPEGNKLNKTFKSSINKSFKFLVEQEKSNQHQGQKFCVNHPNEQVEEQKVDREKKYEELPACEEKVKLEKQEKNLKEQKIVKRSQQSDKNQKIKRQSTQSNKKNEKFDKKNPKETPKSENNKISDAIFNNKGDKLFMNSNTFKIDILPEKLRVKLTSFADQRKEKVTFLQKLLQEKKEEILENKKTLVKDHDNEKEIIISRQKGKSLDRHYQLEKNSEYLKSQRQKIFQYKLKNKGVRDLKKLPQIMSIKGMKRDDEGFKNTRTRSLVENKENRNIKLFRNQEDSLGIDQKQKRMKKYLEKELGEKYHSKLLKKRAKQFDAKPFKQRQLPSLYCKSYQNEGR